MVHIILLHHGDHFWLEQTTLHTQEVNILLVRIFLLYLVRRLSDVECHPHCRPPSLLNYILRNSFNTTEGNNLMQFVCLQINVQSKHIRIYFWKIYIYFREL